MHDAKKHRGMHIIEAYDRENVGSFISMGHNYDKEYDNVVLMGQYLFIHRTMVICISGKQLLLMLGATQAPKLRPESALRTKL
ncbi:hypothetical protein CXB51_007483 [Gossypium anomalum]|uniref:Uncharacterized protein n=1 Tax=Gossypium anomalum TaxID=47600 RepID=A0A8J6D799_9ROSI|nr:hypothetical protein CXB51_007483 [Gossypium anomalum]